MTVAIRYVDGPRLTRSFLAAADWVEVPATAGDIAEAFHHGAHRLQDSRDDPREDTILPVAPTSEDELAAFPAAPVEVAAERDFRHCTELMVRGEQLPAANDVRVQIRNFGGSVQVVLAADILKIHVHTDTPEAVFTFAARWGRIESTKAEDMRAQHRKLAHGDRRPVADSSADLHDGVLDRHHIALVPLQVMFGDTAFLSLDDEGAIVPVDRVRGRTNLVPRVLSLIERRLSPRPVALRFGVVHAEAPETAERVRAALVAAYQPKDCFVTLATGVLGAHVGFGAWAVFWQVEDGTPAKGEAA